MHFLENDAVEIGGTRILGCTLWTDMALYDMPIASGKAAEENISDYYLIRTRQQGRGSEEEVALARLSASDTVAMNKASKDYLIQELHKPYEGKTIVVSHFPPIPFSHPRFDGQLFAPYFSSAWGSDIRDGFLGPDIWICGHTHYNDDQTIGHTRIVSAQRGYPNELGKFKWGVVEV